MSRQRLGNQVNNLFTPTTPKAELERKKISVKTKTTATFLEEQIVWLETICSSIRKESKTVMDRSAVLRGILKAVEDSGMDLSKAQSEDQIADLIKNNLISSLK